MSVSLDNSAFTPITHKLDTLKWDVALRASAGYLLGKYALTAFAINPTGAAIVGASTAVGTLVEFLALRIFECLRAANCITRVPTLFDRFLINFSASVAAGGFLSHFALEAAGLPVLSLEVGAALSCSIVLATFTIAFIATKIFMATRNQQAPPPPSFEDAPELLNTLEAIAAPEPQIEPFIFNINPDDGV